MYYKKHLIKYLTPNLTLILYTNDYKYLYKDLKLHKKIRITKNNNNNNK